MLMMMMMVDVDNDNDDENDDDYHFAAVKCLTNYANFLLILI